MVVIDTAIILVGGLGTRLRPLTDATPKPLLPMKGKPIVQHTIENLKKHGIKNLILSAGYGAPQIQDYFGDRSKLGLSLHYSIETEPLGTGGAVKQAAAGLTTPFFLVWGDNLMDVDYQEMYRAYLRDAPQITMALTPRDDVEHFGVARLEQNKIVAFVEKPKREEAPSTYINAGAFIIDPKCLEMLPEGKSSIERDCFEKLAPLGQISAFIHKDQWFPTDTLEKYARACIDFVPKIDLTKKKVIMADVDETICEPAQEINPRLAEKINALIGKGITFVFISGTPTTELQRMISAHLSEEHHLLANTGTAYSIQRNGFLTNIYTHQLNDHEKKEITAALEKLIQEYRLQPLTSKEDQLQDRETQITLSALGRHAPLELKKQFDPAREKRAAWVKWLRSYLSEGKYEINIGGTTTIDITRKGLDKEWAIREFLKINNFSPEQVVFIGDKLYPGGNDYPASKIVDCIAVKNPEETLQKLKLFL